MVKMDILHKAVFIDRDGTIARDVPYCSHPKDFHLYPGVSAAIHALNTAGFKVVVITNQSGIGRGYFTEETLKEIHRKMLADIESGNARIDGIYYCPHHPDDGCDCRKPKTKLFQQAIDELGINVYDSFMIGDMSPDIEAGKKIGCKTIFVKNGITSEHDLKTTPDFIADNFIEAVDRIINPSRKNK